MTSMFHLHPNNYQKQFHQKLKTRRKDEVGLTVPAFTFRSSDQAENRNGVFTQNPDCFLLLLSLGGQAHLSYSLFASRFWHGQTSPCLSLPWENWIGSRGNLGALKSVLHISGRQLQLRASRLGFCSESLSRKVLYLWEQLFTLFHTVPRALKTTEPNPAKQTWDRQAFYPSRAQHWLLCLFLVTGTPKLHCREVEEMFLFLLQPHVWDHLSSKPADLGNPQSRPTSRQGATNCKLFPGLAIRLRGSDTSWLLERWGVGGRWDAK